MLRYISIILCLFVISNSTQAQIVDPFSGKVTYPNQSNPSQQNNNNQKNNNSNYYFNSQTNNRSNNIIATNTNNKNNTSSNNEICPMALEFLELNKKLRQQNEIIIK